MGKQYAVSVLVTINLDKEKELREALGKIRAYLINEKNHHFHRLDTVHYARWMILDGDTIDGEVIPTQLALYANVDEDEEHFLKYLAHECLDLIHPVYKCCEGYTVTDPNTATNEDKENVYKYLLANKVKEAAFYMGSPGRTVTDIKNEDALHNYIRDFLDTKNWDGVSAKEIHRTIKQKVLDSGKFDWVKKSEPMPRIRWVPFILFCLLILCLLPIVIVWILIIQFFFERNDEPLGLVRSQVPEKHMRILETYEDLEYQKPILSTYDDEKWLDATNHL